ncbi:tRNA pseudouridine(38-40) synthase TruA [Micrococcoides hystricis]|uniref:tRNA pseudouridine synthase A n=1 Tax=Micrococcoides hystricis TaxID=1572761 RepID=A0ABV6P9V1_9MICC
MAEERQRIRVEFAYDGGPYHGWAKQPGLPTVQAALEDALAMIIRQPIATVVAGRTDAGVHANQQVVHADIPADIWATVPRNAPLAPAPAMLRRLNGVLAKDHPGIIVHQIQEVPRVFDARFSAVRREYSYQIADGLARWNPLYRHIRWQHREELNVEHMNIGAQDLLGLHDFLSFCRPRPHSTTIRTLEELSFSRLPDGAIKARIIADAFCHNMVRALIAACVQVGAGQRPPAWLGERLAAAERTSETKLAPAHGLVLEKVSYPSCEQWAARAEQTRARRDS